MDFRTKDNAIHSGNEEDAAYNDEYESEWYHGSQCREKLGDQLQGDTSLGQEN